MKKGFKKLYVGILTSAVAVSTFAPIVKVSADGEYTLTFTKNSSNQNAHTMQIDDGHLKIDGQFVELRNSADQRIDTANCNGDNSECTLTVSDGTHGRLNYNGNNSFSLFMQGHEVGDHEFQYPEAISVEDYVEPGPPPEPGGPEGPQFDGKAYILWSCQGGGICMYHYNNVPNFDDGNSTFYKDTDIVDERTGEHFNINAQYKGWSTDALFNNWVDAYKQVKGITGDINWADVNPADMLGDPIDVRQYEDASGCTKEGKAQDEYEACVNEYAASQGVLVARAQLQPLGEPKYKNAYVSYGDRNFKTVIYNSNYKGVTIGSLNDLHYYTSEWENPYLRRDQYDISGTTKAKPTSIDTILLEKTVKIKEIDKNGFEITKIEALDVPSNAVKINKADGEWHLEFSSNFYDNVVFKVTDSNNKVSYFEIKRYTIDAYFRHENNKPVINADFFFDKERSYTDFNMTAVIVYKNGKEKNITLTPHKGIDDGLGNITDAYEVLDGKGLKKATFQYDLADGEDRTIQDIYLNIEYKGSTNTKYAGSFAGSGRGVKANIYHGEGE